MNYAAHIEAIISVLRDRAIPPDETFEAASGADWGLVQAWALPNGEYGLSYGDNGGTEYATSEDLTDLGGWLLPGGDGGDAGDDRDIVVANVRGIEAISPAPDDVGHCRVIVTHAYYGPSERSDWARGDDGEPLEFEAHSEAAAWVESEDAGIYVTAHNESGRPTFTVVAF